MRSRAYCSPAPEKALFTEPKMATDYYCYIFMCMPSGETTLTMDGVTEIAISVIYAIWDQDGNPIDDHAVIKLVSYEDTYWNDSKDPYPSGVDLNDPSMIGLGWHYATTPGQDVITGTGTGCANIQPTNDGRQYITETFYLKHAYQNPIVSNPPTFSVAASVTFNGITWTTAAKPNSPQRSPNNTQNTYKSLTLADGTPQLLLNTFISGGYNTVIANGNMAAEVDVYFEIQTVQSATGRPLSTQNTAQCKLIAFEPNSEIETGLNGYSGGSLDGSKWVVSDKPGPVQANGYTASTSPAPCASLQTLTSAAVSKRFYVSHSPSFMALQSAQAGVWISYTPPKIDGQVDDNPAIVWRTDQGIPQICGVYLVALSQNQERS
jgi:hypothetical protein